MKYLDSYKYTELEQLYGTRKEDRNETICPGGMGLNFGTIFFFKTFICAVTRYKRFKNK